MNAETQIPQLTEAQIEAIAERAAEVAIRRAYTQIGKSVVGKAAVSADVSMLTT